MTGFGFGGWGQTAGYEGIFGPNRADYPLPYPYQPPLVARSYRFWLFLKSPRSPLRGWGLGFRIEVRGRSAPEGGACSSPAEGGPSSLSVSMSKEEACIVFLPAAVLKVLAWGGAG